MLPIIIITFCSDIQGMTINEAGPVLLSDIIKESLGGIDVSVLMGANIAKEVAKEHFSESTIGIIAIYLSTLLSITRVVIVIYSFLYLDLH